MTQGKIKRFISFFRKDKNEIILKESLDDYKLELITLVQTNQLVARSIRLITNTFALKGCGVLVWDDERIAFFPQESNDNHKKTSKRKWKLIDPFIMWITVNDQILEKMDLPPSMSKKSTRKLINQFFEQTNSSILMPLMRLCG